MADIGSYFIMQKINYEADGRIEILLSEESSWQLFDTISKELLKKFDVKLVKKLDGVDERYWDFEINGGLICLHLQHYLGILIFPLNDSSINEDVKEIAKYVIEKLSQI